MPVAIGLIVGGQALQMYGAKKKADAAKKASEQQVAAADKAQGYNQQVYTDQRALMQPYVQGGGAAYQQLLGDWQGRQPGGAPAMPQGAPPGSPMSMAGSRPQPPGAPTMGQAVPRTPMAMPPGMPGQTGPPAQGGMVKIASPDGSEVRDVPQAQAQMYLSRGGKLVS
ncbi:MAG: hypothetical protein H0X44_05145 [Acidobacteria bacterium]|nr:hypothetical protein [Acidobacteriota bacterium]